MTKLVQPLPWTRLSAVSLSLIFLLAAAAFAATPLGAQAPLGGPLFYQAELTGDSVVPPVASDGSGAFAGEGEERGSEIRFTLTASASGITQAHIHLGGPDENGDVAAFLFGLSDPPVNDVNIDGVLTEADLLGSVAGDWDAFVEAIFAGAYVQVHTIDNPAGELRGQIVVALPATTVDPDEGEDVPGPQPISLDAFLDAVVAAGFGPLQLQEIAVTQPWIPVPGAGILILDGAQAEVYSLSAVQAEQAIGNISGEASAFQPPANAAVWRSLELIVILRDAPSNSPVAAALFNILGSPVLATITGGVPPPPPTSGGDDGAVPEPDTGEESVDGPVALPNTGSGGLADAAPGSGLARSLLGAGIAVAMLLVGLIVWRRRAT